MNQTDAAKAAETDNKAGDEVTPAHATPLQKAIAFEAELGERARTIREEHGRPMDRSLFLKLWPLLREPIPAGFVTITPAVKGKPYESTGIRSVQVCIDRMDAVLTPLWWAATEDYENGGKLCRVSVRVFDAHSETLLVRSSYGGMDHASTEGNLRKGSFTNAAKRAFGMVGPGHEIYLGAFDGDPDTDISAAEEQGKATRARSSGGNAAGSGRRAPRPAPAPAVPPEDAISELVGSNPDLRGLRTKADDGMKILGAKPAQRLRELRAAKGEGDLVALINRIDASLEAAAAPADESGGDA
jgi:hypothetical protein